jgi:hypothetical protein
LAIYKLYNQVFNLHIIMNAFDKHSRNFTVQCEDCDEVFDILAMAKMHGSNKGHKLKVTEFWITGRG